TMATGVNHFGALLICGSSWEREGRRRLRAAVCARLLRHRDPLPGTMAWLPGRVPRRAGRRPAAPGQRAWVSATAGRRTPAQLFFRPATTPIPRTGACAPARCRDRPARRRIRRSRGRRPLSVEEIDRVEDRDDRGGPSDEARARVAPPRQLRTLPRLRRG